MDKFVGSVKASSCKQVRSWRVFIMFHINFIGARMTKARTKFIITPEESDESTKLNTLATAFIRAMYLIICNRLLELSIYGGI